MKIGYARVSTADQDAGFDAQIRDLKAAGCEKIFREKISGKTAHRPQLVAALEFIREGDSFIVTKIDRLARSTMDFLRIVNQVRAKSAGFTVLNMGGSACDIASPTGKLTLTIMASVAEFEREMMLERQREGIAAAKTAGKFKGRPATLPVSDILRLVSEGHGPQKVAEMLGINRASVYRTIKKNTESQNTACTV